MGEGDRLFQAQRRIDGNHDPEEEGPDLGRGDHLIRDGFYAEVNEDKGMADELMLSWGCVWNSNLGMWECHGLENRGSRFQCPHSWQPWPGVEPDVPPHDPKCPIGKMMAMLVQVRNMKIVVDPSLAPNEIRVSDPMVAEWLEGDGRRFRNLVYKEAGYCVEAHESKTKVRI